MIESEFDMKLDAPAEDIRLLIFDMGEIRMGLDMEQVDEMIEMEHAEKIDCLTFRFHEAVPFREGALSGYKSPKVIRIKSPGENVGVQIDCPDNIVTVGLDAIRPLPRILKARMASDSIWGIAFVAGELVVLVDLIRLRRSVRLVPEERASAEQAPTG